MDRTCTPSPKPIGLARFLLLALLFVALGGCTVAASAPVAEDQAEATRGGAEIRFSAQYPATLLYALDGAAGVRNRDEGYRRWLVGEEVPEWLTAYAARRPRWGQTIRPDAGGGAPRRGLRLGGATSTSSRGAWTSPR